MPMLWRFPCKICIEAAFTASFSSCSGPRSFGFAFRPSKKSRGLTRVSASGYVRSVFKIDMILEAVLNEPALSLPDRFCHIRAIQGHLKKAAHDLMKPPKF